MLLGLVTVGGLILKVGLGPGPHGGGVGEHVSQAPAFMFVFFLIVDAQGPAGSSPSTLTASHDGLYRQTMSRNQHGCQEVVFVEAF